MPQFAKKTTEEEQTRPTRTVTLDWTSLSSWVQTELNNLVPKFQKSQYLRGRRFRTIIRENRDPELGKEIWIQEAGSNRPRYTGLPTDRAVNNRPITMEIYDKKKELRILWESQHGDALQVIFTVDKDRLTITKGPVEK